MLAPLVTGIHHVTAFAGDAARNRRFYSEVLGFELVKRTVNFDAPSMWHLYYGLAGGAPGTLLTHFPEPRAARARHGGSEISAVAIACDPQRLDALSERLASTGARLAHASEFGRTVLTFEDPDGMRLALEADARRRTPHAQAEIARVTITVPDARETASFLSDALGFTTIGEEIRDGRPNLRLGLGDAGCGREIDVVHAPDLAPEPMAAGTIHHVAWRVADDAAQAHASATLGARGVAVTPVRDRSYFRSIYFRIPGGVLFEIATDGPGFAIDEPPDALGRALRLPPQYEARRTAIEAALPSLD
ncbi:MAG: ring-cleaving dioxygenase [Phycisphaerales bacterium]